MVIGFWCHNFKSEILHGNQGSINDVRRERGAFPGGTGLSGLTVGCDRPFTYKLPGGRVSVK